MTATRWFIGVSTGQSLVNAAFPAWMRDLGRDVRLVGHDLPPGSPPASYRALVAGPRADRGALGAVITTHKVAVARAAARRGGGLPGNGPVGRPGRRRRGRWW